MGWSKKRTVVLSDQQKVLLREISNAYTSTQAHKLRADIILLAEQGYSQKKTVLQLGTTHSTVNYWKTRWHDSHTIALAYDEELSGSSEIPSNFLIK